MYCNGDINLCGIYGWCGDKAMFQTVVSNSCITTMAVFFYVVGKVLCLFYKEVWEQLLHILTERTHGA